MTSTIPDSSDDSSAAEGASNVSAPAWKTDDVMSEWASAQTDRVEIQTKRKGAWVPFWLLILSFFSMAWAAMMAWAPTSILEQAFNAQSLFVVRFHMVANWQCGVIFSLCLTAILGAHELGHYFVTRLYAIRSTLPIFIPFPISPTGTCGAVIMMDGAQADRKQIFDIGIAGPLAGIVFAIPIAIAGILTGEPPTTTSSSIQFGQPLIVQMLDGVLSQVPTLRVEGTANSAMNPYLMAAWVGFIITGLNMVPISQLDGGHVIFGLLGKKSGIVSILAYFVCVIYVLDSFFRYGQPVFVLMLLLIPLMGIKHPPSRNDAVQLGIGRQLLGWMSLALPILCVPARPFTILF